MANTNFIQIEANDDRLVFLNTEDVSYMVYNLEHAELKVKLKNNYSFSIVLKTPASTLLELRKYL